MSEKGLLILVGAGPGDPGLLTLAGKSAIESADVVLHDRLIGDGILALIPPSAITIDVGKTKGDHPVPQAEINRIAVDHARAGKTVVRLKGGDPFLFGRGAEELEFAVRAGVPFRVVPGVASALAAPALAGIPVTHREYSSSLHILSGHGKDGTPPAIPYRELATVGGTLVFLMAVSRLEEICRNLIDAGLPPETPAALVENGSLPAQRRLSATLASLPRAARARAFSSPSVLVVGPVVELADRLAPNAVPPRHGKNVLVVSSAATAGRLASLLRERGFAADEFAAIALEPLPVPASLWRSLAEYAWIVLTSRFGAEQFFAGLRAANIDIRALAGARFAAVGPRTAETLARRNIFADFVPDEFNGPSLAAGLAEVVKPGEKTLLFRCASGSPELSATLRRHSLPFDDVAAYRTLPRPPAAALVARLAAGVYDALAFTSASAVESFAAAAPGVPHPPAFCIGPSTARAAERFGLRPVASDAATLESMAALVAETLLPP